MLASSALIASVSNPPNFLNLVIFICQLFADGKFRSGHILYEPDVFDDRFLLEIESNCPNSNPWRLTDVTTSVDVFWNQDDSINNILQLIFFDPIHFAEKIVEYWAWQYTAYYKVVIFTSADPNVNIILDQPPVACMLIVQHNTDNGWMQMQWMAYVDGVITMSEERIIVEPNAIDRWNNTTDDTQRDNLFERTFGMYEEYRTIAINIFGGRSESGEATEIGVNPSLIFFLNYYHTALIPSFVHATYLDKTLRRKHSDEIWTIEKQKYYKELTDLVYPYEVEDESELLELEQMDSLHFGSNLFNYEREAPGIRYPLYPYHSVELKILFKYGKDYPRHMNILLIPESVQVSADLIMIFILLTSIVLCIIRKKLKLRRSDIYSAFIDTMIPFIGGGSIRMDHKWEKWFFGILFGGAFFMMSLFADDFLDCIYQILNQKITSFDQLAELVKLGIPVYVFQYSKGHHMEIDFMFSTKIGSNVTYSTGNTMEDAIIFVIESRNMRSFEKTFRFSDSDFDVLPEKLGTINVPYYLESYREVPERQLNRINKVTSSLMESGLNRFYSAFADFQSSLAERTQLNREDEDNFRVLTMQQLLRPLILIIGLWVLAIVIFFVEHIVQKVIDWRGRRVHYLDRQYQKQKPKPKPKPKRLFRKSRGKLGKRPKRSDIEMSNLE